MRIGVIGAGAVGGTIAALLDRAGHSVAVTARESGIEQLQHSGLQLTGSWGEHRARVEASTVLAGDFDIVLLCTKAPDALGALRANAQALAGATLVVVQNGLTGPAAARDLLPDAVVIGGIATFAASYLGPGHIAVTAPGLVYLGTVPPEHRSAAVGEDSRNEDALAVVASVLGAVLPARVVDNLRGAQWTKIIVNQVNAMPAITGMTVQETIASPALLAIITAGMREAVRIGRAAGVAFGSVQGYTPVKLALFTLLPPRLAANLPRRMIHRMGTVPNPGSTLQSIRRGQRTEIDYLNGAIVGAAEKLGLHAPINAALVELVHEVEESGRFFSTAEVVARVAAARKRSR